MKSYAAFWNDDELLASVGDAIFETFWKRVYICGPLAQINF